MKFSKEIKIIEYFLINGESKTLHNFFDKYKMSQVKNVINGYLKNPYIIRESEINSEINSEIIKTTKINEP